MQNEGKLVCPTMVKTPGMVDSVNALILVVSRVIIKHIPEKLGISVRRKCKIMDDDLPFSKVLCVCI